MPVWSEERRGIPYTISEARSVLNSGQLKNIDEYHRELFEFLLITAERQERELEKPPGNARAGELKIQRDTMVNYLQIKMNEQDWHGVMDAAADLRDIDSELKGLKYGDR